MTLNFWSQHMDYLHEIFSCYVYSRLQQYDPTWGKKLVLDCGSQWRQNWVIGIQKFVSAPVQPPVHVNFILERLNILSKPDSLNIDVQVPRHRMSPSTSALNLPDITSTLRKWKFWTAGGLREGSGRRFTSGPTNQNLTRGLIQTYKFLWPSSDAIDFQGQELVFPEVGSYCWRRL